MSKYEVVEKFVSINGEGLKPDNLRFLYVLKAVILSVNIAIPNGPMSKIHFINP